MKIERSVRVSIESEGHDRALVTKDLCQLGFSAIDKFFGHDDLIKRIAEIDNFLRVVKRETLNLKVYEEALSLAERTITKQLEEIQAVAPTATVFDVHHRANICLTLLERRKEIERLLLAEELRKQDGTGGEERLDDGGDSREGVRDRGESPKIATNMCGDDPGVGLKSLLANIQATDRRTTEEVASNPALHPQGDILQLLGEEPQRSSREEAPVVLSSPSKVSEQK